MVSCGWTNPFRITLKPWEIIFVGIYRRNTHLFIASSCFKQPKHEDPFWPTAQVSLQLGTALLSVKHSPASVSSGPHAFSWPETCSGIAFGLASKSKLRVSFQGRFEHTLLPLAGTFWGVHAHVGCEMEPTRKQPTRRICGL